MKAKSDADMLSTISRALYAEAERVRPPGEELQTAAKVNVPFILLMTLSRVAHMMAVKGQTLRDFDVAVMEASVHALARSVEAAAACGHTADKAQHIVQINLCLTRALLGACGIEATVSTLTDDGPLPEVNLQ